MKSALVIGCGKAKEGKVGWAIGHNHARGYKTAFPDIELSAVDIDSENLDAFGKTFQVPRERLFGSLEEALDAGPFEAASVCTWPTLHRDHVVACAKAGIKAVTCEKPVAVTPEQIAEMREVCDEHGVKLAVAHQRRYERGYQRAREIARSGVLGDRLVVQARVGDGWDSLSWTVHWYDMACFILGELPEYVLGAADVTGASRYGHPVEDNGTLLMEFPGGHQALFATGPAALPFGFDVHVLGENGMMVVSGDGVRLFAEMGAQSPLASAYSEQGPDAGETTDSFGSLFKDLWKGVNDPKHDILCGAEHCTVATELAFLSFESSRQKRRLAYPNDLPMFSPLELLTKAPVRIAPPRVVVFADVHHFDARTGKSGRDGLIASLGRIGASEITLVDPAERELTDHDLEGIDVLAIYQTQMTSSASQRAVIERWVAAGRPLAIVHCGIGAYPDWPQMREWQGIYWVWGGEELPPSRHPHIPCEVRVVPESGFSPGFQEIWLPKDEVYMNLQKASDVTIWAEAITEEGSVPVAWQNAAHPNVAVWAPGHRWDSWNVPGMDEGLAETLSQICRAATSS